MKRLLISLTALFLLASFAGHAQVSFGSASKFNDDWKFSLGDFPGAADVGYDDSGWRTLEVPHDWSVEGLPSPSLASCTGYLPGGVAWYRKHFDGSSVGDAARLFIYFEGVYNRSSVYLNGRLLGERPSGYASFMYDLTPWLDRGGDNVIAVRVDHSRCADSRWYTGSGIYRDVWLVKAGDAHFAHWGVGYRLETIDDKAAVIAVDAAIDGLDGRNLRLKLTKNYTLSMSSRFATYAYEFDENGNVYVGNRTEWSYGRFGRWSGYGTSFSWTLNNDSWKKLVKLFTGKGDDEEDKPKSDDPDAEEDGTESSSGRPNEKKTRQAEVDEDGYQVFKMPWSINFSTGFNISEDRTKPINRERMRYPYKFSLNALNINGNIKISNKWSINFNSGYDFESKEITQTTFNITRDLHCFSMSASVAPFGRWKYYNFTIRANASILQDLKYEQRSQTQSNIQWY